jgi:molecular chaperone Hsp33
MTDSASLDNDSLSRFLLQHSGLRGVLVHLDETWQAIRGRAEYPEAVAERLGETCAAAALFAGHVKVEGRLSVQLRGTGALRTLFAECTAAGTLRGIAHFVEPLPEPLTPRAFGAGSVLAITIENHPLGEQEPVRYQGLVSVEADSLAAAFEAYFDQSEQLPTRVLLAADERRAAALMLQQLPAASPHPDNDGWARASALFDTLGPAELLATPAQTLLWRLFHEDDIRLLGQRPLSFACSCSRARVEDVLRSLGPIEAAAAAESGQAQIHCDFCGQAFAFTPDQVRGLFESAGPNAPGSERLQ